jgi:hypothetical protein
LLIPLARFFSLSKESTFGEQHHPFSLSWNVGSLNMLAKLDKRLFTMSRTLQKIDCELFEEFAIFAFCTTHRANEEIFVNQTHYSEVSVHKNFIHDPHDIRQDLVLGVKSCHEQRHIGG